MPDRYAMPKPAKIKAQPTKVEHVSAPLKGLNMSSKLTPGDPLTAPILTNFVVEDDRITCRAGHRKMATMPGAQSVEHLIPYYSTVSKLAAASNHAIYLASTGALIKAGFGGNDWHWTSFSNLGEKDYTVMVNGIDGVWSWDGGDTSVDPGPVTVTKLTSANPAVATVGAGDIGKFRDGMQVLFAGATGSLLPANGLHVISNVNNTAMTFTLAGVNTSGSADQLTGVTADPPGLAGIVKESVTAPASAPWVTPNQFNIVLAHMNRLWFADTSHLAVYFLPIQQKSGEVGVIPLNAVFRRGGTIRAMATWTLDGGAGVDDQLVIFSSNGEAVIYTGVDPDTDVGVRGIHRFDAPMSKQSLINYGGDLYVLISTGLVPMSTMMRAESEQLGQEDKKVIQLFLGESTRWHDRAGWQVFLNPSSNRAICNIPQGVANEYAQMVRHMPRPVWSLWKDLPSRCWAWIDPYLYFGDDKGNVYQMHPQYLNDDGEPIIVDVQPAWSQFKSPAMKHFKMLRTYIITDGVPHPAVDIKTDYDTTEPQNVPDATAVVDGAVWDVADWDTSDWAQGPRNEQLWNGVGATGRVAAPRLTCAVLNFTFSITGWDVLFEPGAAL